MTLNQLQKYIVGVLQGWITNKTVLDKFSETADGKLLYNGIEITVTDEEVAQKIANTLTQFGSDTSAPMVLSVNVNEATGTVTVDGLMFTCNSGTEITDIVITMDEPIFLAENAETIVGQIVKDSTGTILPSSSVGANYGTFTVSDSTITITPNTENAVTSYVGTVDFTIPAGIILDKLGNSKAYTFSLTIIDPFIDTYQIIKTSDIKIAPISTESYDEYSMSIEDLDPNKTNIVTMTLKNVEPHANAYGQVKAWGGIFIPAPEGAMGHKSGIASAWESDLSGPDVSVLDIINCEPKTIDDVVDGVKGYAYYGPWLEKEGRRPAYSCIIQFYEDAECTKPMTNVYKFRMVLSKDSTFL